MTEIAVSVSEADRRRPGECFPEAHDDVNSLGTSGQENSQQEELCGFCSDGRKTELASTSRL